MKKRMNWCGICIVAAVMMTLASISFGQEDSISIGGSNVDISSGSDSVKIDNGKVRIRSKDESLMKKREQKIKAKSSSGVSAQFGTRTYSKDATISGQNINTKGNGLILTGNGDFTLVDCNINAGGNAVIVSGNADVTIKNCVFQGKSSAILIKGNGDVSASRSVFNGKIKTLGNGDYIDNGGNVNNDF